MATIDWPTDQVAFGVRRMQFGGAVSKSAFAGFFTGQTQSISHLANRLRCSVVLRACESVAAARREAWVLELLEAGHLVRLPHLQRLEPNGTLRGTPTVGANAARGARTITLANSIGYDNLLLRSQEFDNAYWTKQNCTVTANTAADSTGAVTLDRVSRTATGNHYLVAGVTTSSHANKTYTFSLELKSGTLTGDIALRIRDGSGGEIAVQSVTPTSTPTRFSVTGTFGSSPAANINVFVDPGNDSGSAGDTFEVGNAQLTQAASSYPYASGATLLAADPIGIGGQLLFAGYTGAVADGAGNMSLPLMWPLRADITVGAGVTWNKPTTTFQCPLSVAELQYGRALWQGEIELPFTEVY